MNPTPSYTRRIYPERISTGSVGPAYDPYQRYSANLHSPRTSGERIGGPPATTLAAEYKTDKFGNIISSSGHDAYRDPRRSGGSISDVPRRRLSMNSQPYRVPDPRPRASIVSEPRQSAELVRPIDRYPRGGYYALPATSSTRNEHRHSSSIDDSQRAPRAAPVEDKRRIENGGRITQGIDRASTFDHPPRGERRGYHLSGPDRRDSRGNASYDYNMPLSANSDLGPARRRERRGSIEATGPDRRSSMLADLPTRNGAREYGPPVTTRGLDRLSGAIARQGTVPKPQVTSPSRDRGQAARTSYEDDDYYIPPRRPRPQSELLDRVPPAIYSPVKQEFDESRESSHHSGRFRDDVASRGFGVRGPSADPPLERTEALDKRKIVPAGTIPDHRREADLGDVDYEPPPRERKRAPSLDGQNDDRSRDKGETRRRDRAPATQSKAEVEDPDYAALLERETHAVQEHQQKNGYGAAGKRAEREVGKRSDRDSDNRGTRESDRRGEREPDLRDREDDPNDKRSRDHSNVASAAIGTAAVGTAALAAGEYARRHNKKDDEGEQPRRRYRDDSESPPRHSSRAVKETNGDRGRGVTDKAERANPPASEDDALVQEAQSNYKPPALEQVPPDEDDEYRRILQQELERTTQAKGGASQFAPSKAEVGRPRKTSNEDYSPPRDDKAQVNGNSRAHAGTTTADRTIDIDGTPEAKQESKAMARYKPQEDQFFLDDSPSEESSTIAEQRKNRVSIVEPPKEKEKPKGILRRPTVKFPDYPEGPKEAVAPLKPVEGVPETARWVKINRSLVSPRALEEAGERFEESRDHVTVLRVLSQDQIRKYAERSKEIREGKDGKDKHDRDRRRKDDDDEDDDDDGGSDENKHRRHRHRKHRSRHHEDDDDDDGKDDKK